MSFLPKSLSRVLWTSAAGIDRDARRFQRLGAILDNVAHIASISCTNVFLTAVSWNLHSLRSRRMKNTGSARYACERETRVGETNACPRGPPKSFPAPYPSNCTRERNLHMITKAQQLCQLNAFCRATTDVFIILHVPSFVQIV